MADWSEEITHVAGTDLAIIKGGQGKPLLVLHEEMGHPGWLNWHAALAKERTLLIPIQPGFGKSPRIEAIRSGLNTRLDDDALTVETRLVEIGAATLLLDQRICRDGAPLVLLDVLVACVGRDGRPRRVPAGLRVALQSGHTSPLSPAIVQMTP